MKRILFSVVLLMSLSAGAQSQEFDQTQDVSIMSTRGGWECYGHGSRNTGGPGGPLPETVRGSGATQEEAFSDTLQRCHQMGLQGCGVDSCRAR